MVRHNPYHIKGGCSTCLVGMFLIVALTGSALSGMIYAITRVL